MSRPHAGSFTAEFPSHPAVRDLPVNRGRALTGGGGGGSQPFSPPAPKLPSNSGEATPLERRPSLNSYGHHRQTSIVHGVQHSRAVSHATTHNGPLGPHGIAAAGSPASYISEEGYGDPDLGSSVSPFATSNPMMSSASNPHVAHYDGYGNMSATVRGPERMHSGRRKDGPHSRSQSRAAQGAAAEPKTVGEFALHHLFNAFVGQAVSKIAQCASSPSGPEPRVEDICGPKVDPRFDQLISALGHVARNKPKPLIDTMMLWRQNISNEAGAARDQLASAAMKSTMNGNTARRGFQQGSHATPTLGGGDGFNPHLASAELQYAVIQAERRSTVSIYLLCRVFIEIISQTTIEHLTVALSQRLEDIIFTQLKQQEPDSLDQSNLKTANWNIFAELLGVMSNISFESVSNRFLKDLDTLQRHMGNKQTVARDQEARAVLLVKGQIHLRLKMSPPHALHQTCLYMQAIAGLFASAHGHTMKYAYCLLLEALLVPVAAQADPELEDPKWSQVVESLRPRLLELLSKPKHWSNVFPTMTILVCVSPGESFAAQWAQLLPVLQPRLKERATRHIALRGLCRLVWRYLYHQVDSSSTTLRKLEEIKALIFQPGTKKTIMSTETSVAEPLIQLIRIIGYKYQDFAFKSLIFPLLNSEIFLSSKDHRIENLEPEKMVIAIRGFLAIMADLENGERPPFPRTFYDDTALQTYESLSTPLSPRPTVPRLVKTSTVREDRLSRAVMLTAPGFGEVAKSSYVKFCKILGEITIICDQAFGGQAVLEEKFGSQTPKTPMAEAFSFARRDEHLGAPDPKQGFYDLLHVAVQALPRCLSQHIPFNSLINLLCTGTAHVQTNIAVSSAQSLKSIAKQSHAQQVTIGFARFIFSFDDRYGTMSDGGMLGPGHIESTLRLYVELLHIWIEEITAKTSKTGSDNVQINAEAMRAAGLDLNSMWPHIDEIESHGLFFLCSPSRRVRAIAVAVLRLITEFDKALGTENTRIIKVLEGPLQDVIDVHDEKLSVAERSRLQRGMRDGQAQSTLVELCSSDTPHDSTLWFKVFPKLVRMSLQSCPMAVALTRDSVCARLSQMQRTVSDMANGPSRPMPTLPAEALGGKMAHRLAATSPEIIVEQWKLYLIFACTALPSAGGPADAHGAGHARKSSKSSQKSVESKVGSAVKLFNMVLPLLTATNDNIRDAAVVGLGSINQGLYYTLLETLAPLVASCTEEAKQRMQTAHQRTPSNPRVSRNADILRTEITHIYKLTSHFLQFPEVYNNELIVSNLVRYSQDLRLFLNDAEVQQEFEFQRLRTHYCGLMEALYEGISRTKDPMRWMSFQSRKAAFTLMEDWCGYSPNQLHLRRREDSMRRSYLERENYRDQSMVTARMEIEKRNLRTAALSAMAVLGGGPISVTTEGRTTHQFDVYRLLSWVDSIFEDVSDRMHAIGRRALKNLIMHNQEHLYLMDRSVEKCYTAKTPKALESYFEVVREVLLERKKLTPAFHKMLPACLYILGNDNSALRTKAARLLRSLEEREKNVSKLQDLDISVSDKTIAVYKNAQFEVSQRLAALYPDMAPLVFSEFSQYFRELVPDHQRNLVAALLPWIQSIELQIDAAGRPIATTYMLLVNLFEITVRCGTVLHNEIQALWQALATGPHAGNVRLILDFIMNLCLEKREQNFVDYARHIVVYLSSTPAGAKVVDFLLLQIEPKAMVWDERKPAVVPQEALALPYLAELNQVLPVGNKGNAFSLGQLSLILLVDLMVAPVQLPRSSLTRLLTVILVLWDNYTSLVQDQAREMLVHLIHELVLTKLDSPGSVTHKAQKQYIENFIDSVRRGDASVVWVYEDYNDSSNDEGGLRLPEAMRLVAKGVVEIFSTVYPNIVNDWAKTALHWATTCSVRHLACRSFQLYRSIFKSLEPSMLCDMLARLSNTIAADETDILTFSMEILTTIRTMVELLPASDLIQYPQLFWTTCACLNTTHEREFTESMAMLETVMDKLDLAAPPIIQALEDSRPRTWDGPFEGLTSLIYKGVRSSVSLQRSLKVLERLISLPSGPLVGDKQRLLFTVLSNLPNFLHSFDQDHKDRSVLAAASTLGAEADHLRYTALADILRKFAAANYRSETAFMVDITSAIKAHFFPMLEYKTLVFLISLLTNAIPWFKIKVMQVLCVVLQDIDLHNPEIASKGPDLISPLLRLLQTEFCSHALQVLDRILMLTAPQTPLDRHHLRMSMAGSHSSREVRKEYETTVSLYGIPHDSGWAIPIPASQAMITRNNVHAVYYSCASNVDAAPPEDTPKIELVTDEAQGGSYFPNYRTATVAPESRKEVHLGDLIAKLDNLDDDFDDDDNYLTELGNYGSMPPSPVTFRYDQQDQQDHPQEVLYDQQTFPLLHKSLTRNASVSSFRDGFADQKYQPRDGNVMNPGAFNVPPLPPGGLAPPSGAGGGPTLRPGLHSRSITSPAVNQRTPPGTAVVEMPAPDPANLTDGTVSEDEAMPTPALSRSYTSQSASSSAFPSVENIIKPAAASARSGFRSGIRRLTGGSADAKDAQRVRENIKSPKVPRVPDMYLQIPKSGEA